jgi:NAD(P)-dependent dehydrogenase (short-subunit alcohol dehydrogenase family)
MNDITTEELQLLNTLLNKVQYSISNNDIDYLTKHNITKIADKCFAISKLFKKKYIQSSKNNISCYMCKKIVKYSHCDFNNLCINCGNTHFTKLNQKYDMTGKIAIVTGGRIKIGYHTAIRLLRNNCFVIITTRFPNDAYSIYSKEPDFELWKNNLHIYGIDFRFINTVTQFIDTINLTYDKIDILINNAAQTICHRASHYEHLIEHETINENIQHNFNFVQNKMITHEEKSIKLLSQLDLVEKCIDTDIMNSWVLKIDQVDVKECAEVMMINVIIPFYFVNSLFHKMKNNDSLIINVSSMEGNFNTRKNGNHIHTNMAKASLNMLTMSSAEYLEKNKIYISSVDPGWASHEKPSSEELEAPIDYMDSASRILDPVFSYYIHGIKQIGVLLKDYRKYEW